MLKFAFEKYMCIQADFTMITIVITCISTRDTICCLLSLHGGKLSRVEGKLSRVQKIIADPEHSKKYIFRIFSSLKINGYQI